MNTYEEPEKKKSEKWKPLIFIRMTGVIYFKTISFYVCATYMLATCPFPLTQYPFSVLLFSVTQLRSFCFSVAHAPPDIDWLYFPGSLSAPYDHVNRFWPLGDG